MKWKDINIEHPNFKKDRHVIVYMPKALQKIDIQTVYSNGRAASCFSEGWNKLEGSLEVTHWMSLPKEPRECCDKCTKTLAYCDCDPIGHQTIDFLDTTHEKPLEPVEDDFVEEAKNEFSRYWVEIVGDLFEERDTCIDFITDLLHRHEAHMHKKENEKEMRARQDFTLIVPDGHLEQVRDIISLITKK